MRIHSWRDKMHAPLSVPVRPSIVGLIVWLFLVALLITYILCATGPDDAALLTEPRMLGLSLCGWLLTAGGLWIVHLGLDLLVALREPGRRRLWSVTTLLLGVVLAILGFIAVLRMQQAFLALR